MNKKVAKLGSEILDEMGEVAQVQQAELNSVEELMDSVNEGVEKLNAVNNANQQLEKETAEALDELLMMMDGDDLQGSAVIMESIIPDDNIKPSEEYSIKRPEKVYYSGNDWDEYVKACREYAEKQGMDMTKDPFSSLLSQQEYEELQYEINDEFAKKTSIKNKTDILFLTIATALQVAKALLFPMVAEKVGYGTSFDPATRFDHNDTIIKHGQVYSKDKYKTTKLEKGNETGEWINILYNAPPYDVINGTKAALGTGLSGQDHRLRTLGHDPILGWIFGTVNILTDTMTLDTFATYRVIRKPKLKVTPEQVPIFNVFEEAIKKAQEGPLNLPAAIMAQGIHLKSDEYTKEGLPVPILETFAPEFAGDLYKNHYDALCAARDLKVIGTSAMLSLLIDMIVILTHGLYYDEDKDGTRNMFEVRTRKILLISKTLATTSNIIFASVTSNPQALDIGGLLVTLSQLFTDPSFFLSVKKEFIENKIYEKIKDELQAIDENHDRILDFEYRHFIKQN